jgi:hypothetical protein
MAGASARRPAHFQTRQSERRTSDGASRLYLVVRRAAVFASEAHHDDFSEVRNGS